MRDSITITILAAALAAAGCHSPAQTDAIASTHASGPSITVPNSGLIPGTPEGDLGDWVGDIRSGIREVGKLVGRDPAAAQKLALELYVTRQEYNEMYYGVDGRIKTADELPQAIETAEERFHELMKLLTGKTPSAADVHAAIRTLDEQQAHVAKLWKKTDAHLNRPVP